MLQDDSSFKQPHLDDSVPQSSPPIPFCPSQTLNISGPLYRGTGANAICPPPLPTTQNSGFSSLLVALWPETLTPSFTVQICLTQQT